MHIIPVLDIKGGRVVRAQMGDRGNYRPIETPLSPTAEIRDVVAGLLSVYPFPAFYVADLDAIEHRSPARHLVDRLSDAFPQCDVWLDAAFVTVGEVDRVLASEKVIPVVGSESQRDASLLHSLQTRTRVVLSLDLRAAFIGPASILEEPQHWPARIIVMTLQRVGANAGPDFDRLSEIKQRAGNRAVYAAGGVRDVRDLRQLDAMGIEGVLVATALHNGALTGEVVASFMQGNQK